MTHDFQLLYPFLGTTLPLPSSAQMMISHKQNLPLTVSMEATCYIERTYECAACCEWIQISAKVVVDFDKLPEPGAERTLMETRALRRALLAKGWDYIAETDGTEIGWVCAGCFSALEGRAGGRGA